MTEEVKNDVWNSEIMVKKMIFCGKKLPLGAYLVEITMFPTKSITTSKGK